MRPQDFLKVVLWKAVHQGRFWVFKDKTKLRAQRCADKAKKTKLSKRSEAKQLS